MKICHLNFKDNSETNTQAGCHAKRPERILCLKSVWFPVALTRQKKTCVDDEKRKGTFYINFIDTDVLHYGTKPGHFETSKIHFPTSEQASERSGGRERSEQSEASERVSGASKRANGRASGPVLQSVFLAVLDHSVLILQLASSNPPPDSRQ